MQKCIVGVPRERKYQEGRVGVTPEGARAIIACGGSVLVEKNAGLLSGFSDDSYVREGANITPSAEAVWRAADIVVKVKEPIRDEYPYLAQFQGKTLFTYLHLAGGEKELTASLLRNEITSIAYETVAEIGENGRKTFPLLVPMSKIAGTQAMRGALSRFPKEYHSLLTAVIIGGGNVGEAALIQTLSAGVSLIALFEAYEPRICELRKKYKSSGAQSICFFSLAALGEAQGKSVIRNADIVISGPMLPGGKEAPIVLTQKHFARMKTGAYIADVSIDQGGSTAWTKGNPTKPGETFTRGARKLVFSATPNIPGSTVPSEATIALTDVTLPYILHLVRNASVHNGIYVALRDNAVLREGLQTWRGFLTNPHVSSHHGIFSLYKPLDALF